MHLRFAVPTLVGLLIPLPLGVAETPVRASAQAPITPPVAARQPVRLVAHGIERIDNYRWLRADNWRAVMQDPSALPAEIRAYVEAENAYAEASLRPLAGLRAKLLREMKGRIEQNDSGVPLPDGPFAYWRKYVPGAEHPQIMRARRDGSGEEILLDGNALATGKPYFKIDQHEHSPDHRLYAYAVDETGSETFTLRVRDIAAKRDLPDVIGNIAVFAWADSKTLFYVRLDNDHRPRFVYRHRLGSDPSSDVLVFEEKDGGFDTSVSRTRSGRFVVITTASLDTTEEWLIDAANPERAPVIVEPRKPNLRYDLSDWGDRLVIRTNADGADDFKVMTAPINAPGRANWRELIPYKQGRQIISSIAFRNHLAMVQREDGLGRLVIRRKSDGATHTVAFEAEAYAIAAAAGYEFDTETIRFTFASPALPPQTFDYDMEKRERVLRKQAKVPSGHDPAGYVVRRLFATTADHEEVPITILHRKGLKLDGSAPLFLEGYGAYAYVFPTDFNSTNLSLVNRGFVYAIAHIRGGLEKGERWRNAGRRENKLNSFNDFIAVAEHLIKLGYTKPGRIVARGDSAGGLLMGAVANMRPELFAGIIARVPFVDALNTMLDESLPLTASDFPEWGDPIRSLAAYKTIASYAPYENVKAQAYPHMLVTGGISDPRVQYWEPLKWVAKLRAMNTNGARIAMVTRMSAGHFGAAGRFEWLDEAALIDAFALDAIGWREPGAAGAPETRALADIVAPGFALSHGTRVDQTQFGIGAARR